MEPLYWECPNCKIRLGLRKRHTLKKRHCPECRRPIEPDEIKDDLSGCYICLFVFGGIGLLWVISGLISAISKSL
ncbi:MAG: hypothetical protein ACFCD0_01050 [Gemmataceae bacterium]